MYDGLCTTSANSLQPAPTFILILLLTGNLVPIQIPSHLTGSFILIWICPRVAGILVLIGFDLSGSRQLGNLLRLHDVLLLRAYTSCGFFSSF